MKKYYAVVSSPPEHSMERQRHKNMKLKDKDWWRDSSIYFTVFWKERNGGNGGEKIFEWRIVEKFPEMKEWNLRNKQLVFFKKTCHHEIMEDDE